MTITRRIALAITMLLIALGGTFTATAGPAAAAPTPTPGASTFAVPGSCANTSLCGYNNDQFSTSGGYEWIPAAAGQCETVGLRNQWTSVYNNGGRTVKLYKQVGCTGGVWTLTSGDSLRNMSLYQPSWNDNIESVRWS